MKTPFWSPERKEEVARAFVAEWTVNRDLAVTPASLNPILDQLSPGKKLFRIAKDAPGLLERIDALALECCHALPPLVGAGGRLVRREAPANGNGAVVAPPPAPASAPEFRIPATAKPASRVAMRPAGRGDRVIWTSDEKEALHRAILAEFTHYPEGGVALATITKAMHKALPEERWRNLLTTASVQEVFDRAVRAVRHLAERGAAPPETREVVREVPVPYDLEKVLREAPLPRLAAALAERECEMRLGYYAHVSNRGSASPAPKPEPALAERGTDETHIEALFPKVQVIGFRPTQDEAMRERFAKSPVTILPSIDPSAAPDKKMLAPGAIYLVDTTTATQPWRSLVNAAVGPDWRRSLYGPNRVIEEIKDLAGRWASKNGQALAQWLQRRGGQ